MKTDYYRKLLMRQWWLIAICIVFLGAGSALGSRFLVPSTPHYGASALVEAQFIGTYGDTNGYIATEAKLADSTRILSTIVNNYPGMTVAQLAGEISGSSVTGTHLVKIDVSDTDPARAAKIANDVANALIADQQRTNQQVSSQGVQQLQNQLNSIQNEINQTNSDLNQARQSNNQTMIASLDTQLSSLREQQALLQSSLTQIQLAANESTPLLLLAQQAQTPDVAVRNVFVSTVKYGLAGIALGLVLGMALVLAFDQLARRQTGAVVAETAGAARAK